ncbi:TetR family transcriptional regulator [Nocardia sp. NPDC057663]|uniref:TetR/AcrR family transcriptional regulator n=1 Tax=Nocardia sp. NPDC057663 TaxID=3346201 RepID=UPI00366CCFF3
MSEMTSSPTISVRAATRELVRERILVAAAELVAGADWKSIRMSDIAERAGLSRRTVFNEFESKAGVLEAVVWRQTARYLEGAGQRLAMHRDDPVAAATAVARYLLTTVADDPLLRVMLAGSSDASSELLTLATTQSGPFVTAVTDFYLAFATQHWSGLIRADADVPFVVESLVRLVFSHMIRPSGPPDPTAQSIGQLAQALLLAPASHEAD